MIKDRIRHSSLRSRTQNKKTASKSENGNIGITHTAYLKNI